MPRHGRMRAAVALLTAALLLAAGTWWWWQRRAAPPAVAVNLPRGETLVYVNVAALRVAGVLAGAPAVTRAPAYSDFVRNSGFDFERDLDAIGLSMQGSPAMPAASTALMAGRFPPQSDAYLFAHAHTRTLLGRRRVYEFPGLARPGQAVWLTFLNPHLLALTNGPAGTMADVVQAYDHRSAPDPPPSSWLPASPQGLPVAALRMDAARLAAQQQLGAWGNALAGARTITAAVRAGPTSLELEVDALCNSPADAARLRDWTQQQIDGLRQAMPPATAPESISVLLGQAAATQDGARVQLRIPIAYGTLRQWMESAGE